MSGSLVAKRYATALLGLVDTDPTAGTESADHALIVLDALSELYQDASIGKVLSSPNMPKDLKLQILEHVASKTSASETLLRFIKVVVEAGRVRIFASINGVFQELLDQSRNIVDARMISVVPIDASIQQKTVAQLEKLLGKSVRLTTYEDKSILGGFILKINNKVIDLSLKSRLNKMAKAAIV